MSLSRPIISIVVPAFNEETVIATCIQHLQTQDFGLPYEIIVANNNSTDKTAAIAQGLNVRVLNVSEKGYVHAVSAGVQAAQGAIIAQTDADSRVPTSWLRRIYETLNNSDLVAVGGPFEFYDGPKTIRGFIKFLNSISPRLTVASLSGTNMAYYKNVYYLAGGYKTSINLQADTYLGIQLAKQGKIKLIKDNLVMISARRYKTIWKIISETAVRIINSIALKLFSTTIFKHQPDDR